MLLTNLEKGKTIHFIGIGGVSMSGLAEIALNMGYKIKGSDAVESETTEKLTKNGIKVYIGQKAENVIGSDLVVYTAAVKKDNPEYVETKNRNLLLMERSEFMGELTKMYKETIGISGTHGKTTTTSMISLCFTNANLDPTIQVGADFKQIGGNYRVGNSPYFIIESCEYVESFLHFHPKTAIILNIEEDHLDYYKDINHIKSAFHKFAALVPKDGYVIYNADDSKCIEAVQNLDCNLTSFGINNSTANWTATNIKLNDTGFYSFTATNGYKSIDINLNVVGYHNIQNSLATIACADIYKIDLNIVKKSLEAFKGAERRFEYRGMINGAKVYDDYAHHPTEIKATIESALKLPHNKIYTIFQPHTYSRTKSLFNEFVKTFTDSDCALFLDIYASRESLDTSITTQMLVDEINNSSENPNALYVSSFDEAIEYIKNNAKEGDIVLTIGAGTVTKISHELVK